MKGVILIDLLEGISKNPEFYESYYGKKVNETLNEINQFLLLVSKDKNIKIYSTTIDNIKLCNFVYPLSDMIFNKSSYNGFVEKLKNELNQNNIKELLVFGYDRNQACVQKSIQNGRDEYKIFVYDPFNLSVSNSKNFKDATIFYKGELGFKLLTTVKQLESFLQ